MLVLQCNKASRSIMEQRRSLGSARAVVTPLCNRFIVCAGNFSSVACRGTQPVVTTRPALCVHRRSSPCAHVAEKLREYYEKFGELTDSIVMRDRDTQNPRGFGFVTYKDETIAEQVAASVHELDGRKVRSQAAPYLYESIGCCGVL